MPLTPQQIAEMDALTGLQSSSVLDVHPNAQSRISELDALDGVGEFTGDSKAPFQATGEEGLIKGTAKAIGNAPGSTVKLVKNVADVVLNPIDTAKGIGGIVKGLGAKGAQLATEGLAYTDAGQEILKAAQARGGNVTVDEKGMYHPGSTEDTQKFDQLIKFFTDRYGSVDKLKETAIEDPVGVLADVASVFSGGGAAARTAKMGATAEKLSEAGRVTNPLNAIPGALSKTKTVVGESPVGQVIADVSPTSYKMLQGQVTKALELTPGDLATIAKKTGNDVTKFISDNNLIKSTPEEIAHALDDMRKSRMAEVRGEIANVKNTYSVKEVPSFKKGLDSILGDVENVPGLEAEAAQIAALSKKTSLSLDDIQTAKELLDKNTNIYSKTGDVKSATKARGLDIMRKELKTFIENEVTKNTDGATNIRQLNNDVMTTHAIEDAITTRATRGMSRQYLTAYDLALGMGGAYFHPLVGAGIVVAKKLAQSPTLRLGFAKLLSGMPIKTVKRITKELTDKNVSPETKALLQQMVDSVAKNSPYIESGANALPAIEE